MDSEIEVLIKSGTHKVESGAMVAQNFSGEEDIMSIAPIPSSLVYGGFRKDISASLVYKSLRDSQHKSPTRYHMLEFLCSCMVIIWRNIDTKPL